jgi:copper(I)-binding protein
LLFLRPVSEQHRPPDLFDQHQLCEDIPVITRIGLSIVALVISIVPVVAQEYKAGPLQVENPWARATPNGAKVGGGYLTIKNDGTAPDKLVGGSSPIAQKLEVDEMSS